MSKIQHFSACQGEEYFTVRPHPSRRGGFSFIPVTRLPHRRVTTGPARLHQRPSGKKIAQHAPSHNRPFFASRANLVSVPPRIHSCRASFISPSGTAAWPPVPPAPWPGPAGLAAASNRSGCLCVAWPGPAATHRHRGRSLRCPPAPSTPVVPGL